MAGPVGENAKKIETAKKRENAVSGNAGGGSHIRMWDPDACVTLFT